MSESEKKQNKSNKSERLSSALRENLKRRKAQMRGRKQTPAKTGQKSAKNQL